MSATLQIIKLFRGRIADVTISLQLFVLQEIFNLEIVFRPKIGAEFVLQKHVLLPGTAVSINC